MNKEKLHKYALNKLTSESEIEEVLDWIESSENNKREFETLKNLWVISGFANYDNCINTKTGKSQKIRKYSIVPISLVKYAAVFVFAFFIGSILFYYIGGSDSKESTLNQIIVPDGESAEVYLSDNTHVWLNSGSKLIYPARFKRKSRKVKLIGEAYFDVEHNSDNPFFVETPEIAVVVKGTSFNVQAYDNDEEINITLVEGEVSLQTPEGKVISELVPGENAKFNINQKKIYIGKANTEYYTSWKNGYLEFKNENLENILRKFERWYNVKVIFDDEDIRHIKFTGTIMKNKSLDQIFSILKFTAQIDYSFEIINDKPSIIHLKKKPM